MTDLAPLKPPPTHTKNVWQLSPWHYQLMPATAWNDLHVNYPGLNAGASRRTW